jgi:hypothetical protein
MVLFISQHPGEHIAEVAGATNHEEVGERVYPEGPGEAVSDKGYHSTDTLQALAEAEVRSYISEPDRGRRCWQDKPEAQTAVYGNRRRIRGEHGKVYIPGFSRMRFCASASSASRSPKMVVGQTSAHATELTCRCAGNGTFLDHAGASPPCPQPRRKSGDGLRPGRCHFPRTGRALRPTLRCRFKRREVWS